MSNQENNQLVVFNKFKATLTAMINKSVGALPSDINSDRLKINALMYIQQDKDLYKLACDQPDRISQYVYNFIALGLDMLNKECYIIPFGNKLTVLKDYKGEVKLVRKYAIDPIREIYARVVYEQDNYYFDEDNKFIHKFDPFKTNRGNKIGAFCTVIYQNGVQQTEFINVDEIAKVKAVSQSANSDYSPWKKWEDEMFKKTVIRKAMKNISLDFGNSEVQKAYQESDTDVSFSRNNNDEVIAQGDPTDKVIDVESKEIPNEPKEVDFDAI